MRVFKSTGTDSLLICLIIIIGAVLRFYNYADIPFTHDEFSALFRTQFSNFHDLIIKGVLVDTHPAGVQVFLYYWVKLVGISEPLVKLPFKGIGAFPLQPDRLSYKGWYKVCDDLGMQSLKGRDPLSQRAARHTPSFGLR